MSITNQIISNDYIESLADELAMLYLKKCNDAYSDPKDLARRYVEIQEIIAKELKAISRGE